MTTGVCGGDFLCWWLFERPDPGESLAGLCFHDSGGPLFAELPEGRVLAGVNHSTGNADCQPPAQNLATEVYSRREWIAQVAGADLASLADPATCGGVPVAGEPGGRVRSASGSLSEERPEASFFVQVPAGTGVLRFGLTTTGRSDPADADFDLYVRHGARPDPDDAARKPDCASAGPSGIEFCEIREPEPGPWYAAVRRAHGEGRYQIVATQLDGVPPEDEPDEPDDPEEPPPPPAEDPEPPPELPWIDSPALPGFEAKVRIGGVTPGKAVEDCVAETVCVSGALADRPEVFLKVVGPRPNGHLWVQIARFTPARVEIWLHRRATGEVRHYVLDPVAPAALDVPGLQDRQAFFESL